MSTSNQSDLQVDLNTVLEKIRKIAEKSTCGSYIYRGEPEEHEAYPYCGKVSSSLWRLSPDEFESGKFCIERVQKEILEDARNYTNEHEKSDFELLTQLQHYGSKTNLIDFTTDYLIALFFACDGCYDKDGRVILLENTKEIKEKYRVKKPWNPQNRVIAQKSIFVRPPNGFIVPDQYKTIKILKCLKQPMLEYLGKHHGIFNKTIYNDLHGFITHQSIHHNAYTNSYKGLTYHARGDYEKAIEHYSKALKLNPRLVVTYNNRGGAYRDKGEYNCAIKDYTKAIQLNPNYVGAYNNRGFAYSNKGEYDCAIIDYTKAIQLNPNYFNAYKNRGGAYRDKGEYNCAIKDYTKAIQLNPNDINAYDNYRAWLSRIIEDCRTAIEHNPNDGNAFYNCGLVWLHLQAWEKAKSNLIGAREKGIDIITAFHSGYGSVADFERVTGIQLPENIAAMLTAQQ